MKISKTTSGTVKIVTDSGNEYFLSNLQNIKIKPNTDTVTIIYTPLNTIEFPVNNLTINDVLFSGTPKEAAALIATTVFSQGGGNGEGVVMSVSGVFPDENGNVLLAVDDVDGLNDTLNNKYDKSDIIYGATLVTMDGVQTIFNIDHGMGVIPGSFAISFGDASNLNFVQSARSLDENNIILTCFDAPQAGSQTVYWQVFK